MQRSLIFIIFLLTSTNLNAQCLSREVTWSILDLSSFDLSDPKRIQYLSTLKRNAFDCGHINDSLEAKINQVIGKTFFQLQSLDSARQYISEAIRINSSNSPKVNAVHNVACYFNLGLIEKNRNRPHEAITALSSCVGLAQNLLERSDYIAKAYSEISAIYYNLENFSASMHEARLGELHARSTGSVEMQVKLILQQAEARHGLKDNNATDQLIRTAIGLSTQSSNPSLAGHTYAAVADLQVRQNRNNEALRTYLKALDFLKKNPADGNFYATVSNRVANLFISEKDDLQSALAHYKAALKTATETRNKAESGIKIARIYSKMKQRRTSLEFYQKTLSILIPEFQPSSLSGNPATGIMKKLVNKPDILKVITEKGNVWLDSLRVNNLNSDTRETIITTAIHTYQTADSLLHQMLWQYSGVRSYWRNLASPLYQNALEVCYLGNQPYQALLFIERGKFILLRDKITENLLTSILNKNEAKQYEWLSEEIMRYHKLVEHEATTEQDLATFRETLARTIESRERLIRDELGKINYFKNFVSDGSVVNVQRLRQEILAPMEDTGAYLTYYQSDKSLYGLLVTPQTLRLRKISLQAYQRLAPEFLSMISREISPGNDMKRFLDISHALYGLLVAPFPITRERRIIVSPSNNLLPFEALSFSGNSPDYLVKTFAFSYTYSSAFLDPANSVRKSFPFYKTFLGMAPTLYSLNPNQNSRADSSELLESISSNFLLPKTYTGYQASARRFLQEAPDYRVVQLFTHTSGEAELPSVRFSDSLVTAEKLYQPSFHTQLIVLPACEPANTDSTYDRKAFGLAKRFIGLGASSVITFLWNTGNRNLHHETSAFYDNLRHGIPLDLVLQKTKLELLGRESAENVAPHRWAGMVLIGNTVPVATNKEVYWGLLIGISIFMLTLYITFVYQKKRQRRFARLRKRISKNHDS